LLDEFDRVARRHRCLDLMDPSPPAGVKPNDRGDGPSHASRPGGLALWIVMVGNRNGQRPFPTSSSSQTRTL
jgi:hypothetical protein